jgi:hypothetical protein
VIDSERLSLKTSSFDTLLKAVKGSLITDSSPVAYKSRTAAVDAASAAQVEAARVPQRQVIERLKTELELARILFSLDKIISAPSPIPPGYVSNAVVSKAALRKKTSLVLVWSPWAEGSAYVLWRSLLLCVCLGLACVSFCPRRSLEHASYPSQQVPVSRFYARGT